LEMERWRLQRRLLFVLLFGAWRFVGVIIGSSFCNIACHSVASIDASISDYCTGIVHTSLLRPRPGFCTFSARAIDRAVFHATSPSLPGKSAHQARVLSSQLYWLRQIHHLGLQSPPIPSSIPFLQLLTASPSAGASYDYVPDKYRTSTLVDSPLASMR
jgi:hypothetical protein